MPEKKRALMVAQYLVQNNLTGIAEEEQYRDLQNNFIGIALQDENHPSLPLISVAIYCSVAQRFGLDARCCGFPNHVHAVVYPRERTESSEDASSPADELTGPMYLDPFRSADEVSLESLHSQLVQWGVPVSDFDPLLGGSKTTQVVLRTSRNILATVHEWRGPAQEWRGNTDIFSTHPTIKLYGNPFADMDNAFYSALWANFLLVQDSVRRFGGHLRRDQLQFVPMILERFENTYPWDGAFIEQFICAGSAALSDRDRNALREAAQVVKASDSVPKQVRPRSTLGKNQTVAYQVGQVFRHRRYNYTAVITGWDAECSQKAEWIETMGVDKLSRGRKQSFYHSL
jgi:F-box protein 21